MSKEMVMRINALRRFGLGGFLLGLIALAVSCGGQDNSPSRIQTPELKSGLISTVAGNNALGSGYSGDNGPAIDAQLQLPYGIAVDEHGNLFVSDTSLHSSDDVVRKIDKQGIISTVAGNRALGWGYSGDGGLAINAQLSGPMGVAVDAAGNLFIADTGNHVVRKVDTTGKITTVAGNYSLGPGYSGDGGLAINAQLSGPVAVAVDTLGNLFIADGNNVIRRVDITGKIATVAGNYYLPPGYSGDGGYATNARLLGPMGMAVDRAGNLFIADSGNHVVRRVDTTGKITTIAGNYSLGGGYSGDGGPASNAQFNQPVGVAVDIMENIFIADFRNNVARKVDTTGKITTVAGNYSLGAGYSGDGGSGSSAQLNEPTAVAVDGDGNLFIADYANFVVRKVTKP